jgi:3',5'-cyclic AMP phosphodiesterase CpdA
MKQIRRFAAFLAFVLLLLVFGISWLLVVRAGRDSSGIGDGSKAGASTDTALAQKPARVLVGAGDVAVCGSKGAEATAKLLDVISGTVFVAGDAAYGSGTARQFRDCYGPTWGRHKARTRPSPGNHEYNTKDAVPYFEYFGANAGEVGKGYYSYDLGVWHIIALNSNIPAGRGSEQMKWLRADLAANEASCTLAYWHHPLFSSGEHGNEYVMLEAWRVLYEYKADVVLNGHDHSYERFAPQTPQGKADPGRGIREFVVGTGGAHLRGFERIRPNSEVRNSDTWGVLKLTLHPAGYDWEFVPVAGKSFRDSGSAACVR